MFSVPINPKFNHVQYNYFIDFLKKHKEHIYDLYFTCRMPPFMQDAMGDVITSDPYATIEAALQIQAETGITISATFNNTEVRPTQDNLDLFIQNFRQLYDAGVRSATIPHTHWVATGQLQHEFPELQIKNTILRQVETAKDVAALGKEGFHYVNIHRDLMRDQEALKRIRKAADKYDMKVALLGNEGCHGGCSMMKEHFQFNNQRSDGPQYFNDPISRVSCSKWNVQDPASPLKEANFPPWREDWVELLEYVDVFKMHGRESVSRLFETMVIIQKYASGKEILYDNFNSYLDDNNMEDRPINAWRKIIKTCKFDCWDCNFCDKVYASKSQNKINDTSAHVVQGLVDHINNEYTNQVPGLTAYRVKRLLHEFAKFSTNYLELGSAMGATARSVLDAGITATCVDNWSQNIQPQDGAFELAGNDKELFIKNTKGLPVTVVDHDLLTATISGKFDLVFYDGPHDKETTSNAVQHYAHNFADTVVIIFDDANWDGVVQGAAHGISQTDYTPILTKMVLNNVEDSTKWWNGLYIMVATKNDT